MSKILKSNVLGTILMIPFFISIFLLEHFWGWVIFSCYFLLLGIYFILLLFFVEIDKKSRLFKVFAKGTTFLVALGFIVFFYFWGVPSIKDIPNKINDNYSYIVGVPTRVSDINTRGIQLWRNIEISDLTLKNMKSINSLDSQKTMVIQYLPNSKYVNRIAISSED